MATTMVEPQQSVEAIVGADAYGAAIARQQHPADRTKVPQADPRKVDADRVRNWYLIAVNHPFWQKYIPAAREDEGYYIGGDLQWSKDGSFDSLRQLRAKKRTAVSINHIQSTVDILVGFERQNRYDTKASPQGSEDVESARILTWILRFVQEQAEVAEYESECFEDGLIRGLSALDCKNKFHGAGLDGEVEVEVLVPGDDCLWDPYWKKNDLSDCRFFLRFRWAYLDEVLALYPEHEEAIQAQVHVLDTMFGSLISNATTDGGRGDAYGTVGQANVDKLREEELFFDPRDRRILVVEAWYADWVTKHHVVTKNGAFHAELPNRALADEMAAQDPANLTAVHPRVRKIRECLVLPATGVCLYDKPSRYENDDESYPQVIYVAKRKREHAFGVVRNMKDPQLLENMRISQVVDILKRWGNIRPLVPKGAVEDERGLEEHWSTSAIVYDPKKGAPGWYVPQGLDLVARGLIEIAVQFKLNLREITGINTDLLGLDTSGSAGNSGIAIARRQAQGQITATVFYDNYKRFRKLVAQRLARRAQEAFTTEQVLRLIDPDTGDHVEVLINPAEAMELQGEEYQAWLEAKHAQRRDGEGRPYVLRSLKALKYDISMSEAPTTPNARAAQLAALMEIVRLDPRMLAAVIDKIVGLAEIPDRPEIIRRIRALQIQAGITPTGMPGGQTVPGAPVPGVPPVPPGGIQPAAPPAVPPAAPGGGPGGLPPTPPTRGVSNDFRQTLALASGGAPIRAGRV